MSKTNTNSPDLLTTETPAEFLSLALKERKSLSLRALAKRAGFTSPTLLSLIISGKRKLTPSVARRIAQALGLQAVLKTYLVALAGEQTATTIGESSACREKILQARALQPQGKLKLSQYRFMGVWYYPVLYVLIGLDDFQENEVALAGRIGRGVKPDDIRTALSQLLDLGLVHRDPDGKLRQVHGPVSTTDDIPSQSVDAYHDKMLRFAHQSLALPKNEREISGLTISIPTAELPRVKEKFREFRRSLNEELSRFDQAENVYQVQLALFPLIKPKEISETTK